MYFMQLNVQLIRHANMRSMRPIPLPITAQFSVFRRRWSTHRRIRVVYSSTDGFNSSTLFMDWSWDSVYASMR